MNLISVLTVYAYKTHCVHPHGDADRDTIFSPLRVIMAVKRTAIMLAIVHPLPFDVTVQAGCYVALGLGAEDLGEAHVVQSDLEQHHLDQDVLFPASAFHLQLTVNNLLRLCRSAEGLEGPPFPPHTRTNTPNCPPKRRPLCNWQCQT